MSLRVHGHPLPGDGATIAPMDFQQLVLARRSVRSYRPDPVAEPLLRQVLESAWLAPSACNRQPFRVVVIRTRGRETEFLRVYPGTPFGWPADEPAPKERKPLEELVRDGRW